MSFSMIAGNVRAFGVLTVSLNPASVAANTTAEQTFTVPGLQVGDLVWVNTPPIGTGAGQMNAGLGVCGARVSAADTLALRFNNNTAGALDAGAADYTVLVVRPGATPGPGGFAP
jgi:hypothetical protein